MDMSSSLNMSFMCGAVSSTTEEEEDDAISFVDLTDFPGVQELDNSIPDSTSGPINIPLGLLFGDQIVTSAYVS